MIPLPPKIDIIYMYRGSFLSPDMGVFAPGGEKDGKDGGRTKLFHNLRVAYM